MKRAAFLLALFASASEGSAQSPQAFANTYTLSDADGFTGFNYLTFAFHPSGRWYNTPYGTEMPPILFKNNTATPLDSLRRYAGGVNQIFPGYRPGEATIVFARHIALLRADTVIRVVERLPSESFWGNANCQIFYPRKRPFGGWKGTMRAHAAGRVSKVPQWEETLRDCDRLTVVTDVRDSLWLAAWRADTLRLYRIHSGGLKLEACAAYALPGVPKDDLSGLRDERNFYLSRHPGAAGRLKDGRWTGPITLGTGSSMVSHLVHPYVLHSAGANHYRIHFLPPAAPDTCWVEVPSLLTQIQAEPSGRSFLGTTGNKPVRIFPWLRRYPKLYDGGNSSSIFALVEDGPGRIWAASYAGMLTAISGHKVTQHQRRDIKWLNGGVAIGRQLYLIGDGKAGLSRMDATGRITTGLSAGMGAPQGFALLASHDGRHVYYGGYQHAGLGKTTVASLLSGKPIWEKIDFARGSRIENILTIAEDTTGRVWYGHPRFGIAVYSPVAGVATTWLREKSETAFGAATSVIDSHGAVWMGGLDGLWCYADYSRPATPASFRRIKHPLLRSHAEKKITALTECAGWLIIAAYNKVLALDLRRYHASGEVVLRYLSRQEAALTSFTEQNTMLTARDSSVWFATSDMLYRWDFLHWLQLPVDRANLHVRMLPARGEEMLSTKATYVLPAGFNTFDLRVEMLSPDHLPRYASAALFREGDSINLPPPSLEINFSQKNLASGTYAFVVEVYELDGSMRRYTYPLRIQPYFWKTWWFWALCCVGILAAIAAVMRAEHRRSLARGEARRKAAELEAYRAEQEKKLAELQLVTLSNQFRPHFILNALNTIGSRMDGDPEMESVLSRLGESINLIFSHAQEGKVLHAFEREWSLVECVISIQQAMYLRGLETRLPSTLELERVEPMQLPLGMLQVPVENALMHGLRNRDVGPWILEISIVEMTEHVTVSVTDNGVGRARAAELSMARKHGTGTRNLAAILATINAGRERGWGLDYEDGIFTTDTGAAYGTRCNITIPKSPLYGDAANDTVPA